MDDPAPPAVDPEVYAVLRSVWRTYPLAAEAWREVVPWAERAGPGLGLPRDDRPLLDDETVRWDAAPLPRQIRRLRRVLRSPLLGGPGVVEELRDLLDRGDEEPIEWARRFLRQEDAEPRAEELIGGWVLQPFLYAFARHVEPRLGRADRERSRCPICGGRPCHGYLDSDSRRKVLICAKCFCPWNAPRLQCPFCGNARQELLSYYYDDRAPRQRIDSCAACRSLLPITLEREASHPFPLRDHLASMPLQAAVERSSHVDQSS